MKVTVASRADGEERTLELAEGSLAGDMLRGLGLHAHATLVLRGGEPVPDDAPLEDGGAYELITVASGG